MGNVKVCRTWVQKGPAALTESLKIKGTQAQVTEMIRMLKRLSCAGTRQVGHCRMRPAGTRRRASLMPLPWWWWPLPGSQMPLREMERNPFRCPSLKSNWALKWTMMKIFNFGWKKSLDQTENTGLGETELSLQRRVSRVKLRLLIWEKNITFLPSSVVVYTFLSATIETFPYWG